MTVSPTDRTKLNTLMPNLAPNQIALSALRLAVFQEIYTYLDDIINDLNNVQAVGSVSTAKLADASVISIKISDGAVTNGKIADGAVVTLKLANGAVTSVKLTDLAVTAEKLANFAVTRDKIELGSVGANQLDPMLLKNFGDIAVQAKFTKVDEQLADKASNASVNAVATNLSKYTQTIAANKKQYVIVDRNNFNVKIQSRYGTSDLWVELAKCGVNNIFSFYKWHKNTNNVNTQIPTGIFSGATLSHTADTDILSPMYVRAATNADGDSQTATFTGGFHGYNGDATGAPTARQVSLSVYVDSAPTTIYEGYCEQILIESVFRIQGWNTKKADGTGREIVEQRVTMLFKEGKCEIFVRLVALESVDFSLYYGIQTLNTGMWGNGTIHYLYGDATTRKPSNAANNSGLKSSYPNVDRMVSRGSTSDDFIVWIDRTYGIGQGQYCPTTEPLAFTTSYGKSYFNLIKNQYVNVTTNNALEFHGGICFVKGDQNVCDLSAQILRNGILWEVLDFLVAGTEVDYPYYDEWFRTGYTIEEFKKDAGLSYENVWFAYKILSTGYGSFWFRFKK